MYTQVDKDEVEARLSALAEQRNAAMNLVAELNGKLAVADRTIKQLMDNGSKLVAEAEEAKVQLDGMSTIVGLL